MSAAPVPPGSSSPGGRTVVWLPLSLSSRRSDTGIAEFLPEQIETLAQSLPVPSQNVVSPDPLGMRSDFAQRLAADLNAAADSAFRDFCLLVEGLAYGLLRPETYDLNKYRLGGSLLEDRYLTVLLFRTDPHASETCAGSFAPDTLVCPAPRWRERAALDRRVLEYRNRNEGRAGRGLLSAFLATYGAGGTVWSQALQRMLTGNPGQDPGPGNQRNVGAFYLRTAANASPRRVFFPVYGNGYLEGLMRRLSSDTLLTRPDRLEFWHQGRLVSSLNQIAHDQPSLFGLGCELGDPPATTGMTAQANETVIESLSRISNEYLPPGFPINDVLDKARFEFPDCLRYFFWKFGEAAELIFSQSHLYSLHALSLMAGARPPDPATLIPGLNRNANGQDLIYVELLDGARAYYVERFRGSFVGELSGLGYALWMIFCKEASWQDGSATVPATGEVILRVRNRRLSVIPGARPLPDVQKRAAEVMSFVDCSKRPGPGLFQSACEAFLGDRYAQFNRGSLHPVDPVNVDGRPWWRIQ
ncbi:MAG TPA: hypothetical protein VMF91_04130 [Bryobacteraceae bacterium]|nr:hypothetical protein [Bryobacteraceae bacterium]